MATRTEKNILIRVDASESIGYGHLMRSLALAQACKTFGFSPIFISYCDNTVVKNRIIREGFEFISITAMHPAPDDLKQTIAIKNKCDAEWVVVDGYHFDEIYLNNIRENGSKLLVIDDLADKPDYQADIILNQNIYATYLKYPCNSEAILLFGLNYFLMRKEFLILSAKERRSTITPRKVLVTMGGSDQNNVTLTVIKALCHPEFKNLECAIIVGSGNPNKDCLQNEICRIKHKMTLLNDPTALLTWMKWADLAITGGGCTCYELAALGVPSLIISLAENQLMLASGMEKAGAARYLGWYKEISIEKIISSLSDLLHSPDQLIEMSHRGQNLSDGLGSSRVARWIQDLSINVRLAYLGDCHIIYEWANDPVTRSVSFSKDIISWENHQKWFRARLEDPDSVMFIGFDANALSLGIVRFQIENNQAIISINVNPEQRGKGYGSHLLRVASKRLFQAFPVSQVNAYIKPDNKPSIRAFSKAGFQYSSTGDYQGHPADLYILKKDDL